MKFLKDENAETEVLPLVNNFDPTKNQWISNIEPFLNSPEAHANFRQQAATLLASENYKGLTLDFEGFPRSAQPGFRQLVDELHTDLQAKGMKLHIAVPINDDDFDYAYLAAHSDGLILMNYDEHFQGGDPGPIASQEWFTKNLVDALKIIPKDKLICAIGSYGYDWSLVEQKKGKPKVDSARSIDDQEAWLSSSDSEAPIELRSRQSEPAFRVRGRKRQASRRVVSGRRHRAQPDARRRQAGHQHLRAVAARLGGPLAVDDIRPARQSRRGAGTAPGAAGSGRGHGRRRRGDPHRQPAVCRRTDLYPRCFHRPDHRRKNDGAAAAVPARSVRLESQADRR